MLIDASVARSFAVIGWTRYLTDLSGGTILIADGVHSLYPDDQGELRRIRAALQRQAEDAQQGSGIAGRASAAVLGLDELLALGESELTVLALTDEEVDLAGESGSIAIAFHRSLGFASDDEDALTLWQALTGTPGHRTRDLLWRLVANGTVPEAEARAMYDCLQTDELHNLGGPPWQDACSTQASVQAGDERRSAPL